MESSDVQVLKVLDYRASTSYHESDFREHDSRQAGVYCAIITMFTFAVLVVSLRFYSRSRLSHFRGSDDYWILAAMCSSATDFSLKISWLQFGFGLHSWNLTIYELEQSAKLTYVLQGIYPLTLGLAKISILTFYLRLFPYETFRRICYFGRFFVGALTISISLSMLLACKPISYGWSLHPQGHCVSKARIQFAASSLNLLTDLCTLLLPIRYLWAMSADKKKRFGCITLFSLGLITCIASAIRITTIAKFYETTDSTWTGAHITICSAIECNLAIITPSIPACQPIIRAFSKKVLPQKYFSDTEGDLKEFTPANMPKRNYSSSLRMADPSLETWNDTDV